VLSLILADDEEINLKWEVRKGILNKDRNGLKLG